VIPCGNREARPVRAKSAGRRFDGADAPHYRFAVCPLTHGGDVRQACDEFLAIGSPVHGTGVVRLRNGLRTAAFGLNHLEPGAIILQFPLDERESVRTEGKAAQIMMGAKFPREW